MLCQNVNYEIVLICGHLFTFKNVDSVAERAGGAH